MRGESDVAKLVGAIAAIVTLPGSRELGSWRSSALEVCGFARCDYIPRAHRKPDAQISNRVARFDRAGANIPTRCKINPLARIIHFARRSTPLAEYGV
jgi:hypothetical protein